MGKAQKSTIDIKGTTVSIVSAKEADYICLTDIARYRDAARTDYRKATASNASMKSPSARCRCLPPRRL